MKDIMLPGCQAGELEKTLGKLLDNLTDDIWSHPNKPLRKHLMGVYQGVSELKRRFSLPLADDVLSLMALLHDIYKADARFQRYIRKEGEGVPHALPSAQFAFLLGNQHGMDLSEVVLAAEAIRRHHTHLEEFDAIENRWAEIGEAFDELESIAHLHRLDLTNKWQEKLDDLFFDLQGGTLEEAWLKLRLLLSVLVAADRINAAELDLQMALNDVPQSIQLPEYKENEINRWRSKVQAACFENAINVIQEPGLYSLSLPTGAGKTLLGLKIAHHLVQTRDYRSIIYALPFISIVEQTTQTAVDLLGCQAVQEDHSLRPIDSEEYESNPIRRMADLFRYWYAPVVLTTFAQLWDAFFAPQANQTMNFHRLSRAVVILDEPQTIAPKYWQELSSLMGYISRELGTIFLLMTATQPLIVDPYRGRREIAPKAVNFPTLRHRYTYLPSDEGNDLEAIVNLLEEYKLLEKKRGLILLNTRKAVLEAFDILERVVNHDGEKIKLRVLSTWLTPAHRRRVIREIRQAEENGERVILISTQVIEAGVDLDFEWVIRDFAPFDSIIQAAGRCNRHGKRKEPGVILVVPFRRDEQMTCTHVYDKVLREATKNLLKEQLSFDENDVREMTERYFRFIGTVHEPKPLFKKIMEGKWEDAPYLYEGKPIAEVSVIVEENEQVREWINELEKNRPTLETLITRKALMQKLQQHIVQVPAKALQAIRESSSNFVMNEKEPMLIEVLGGSFYLLRNIGIGSEAHHPYHLCKGFVPVESKELEEALIF